MVETAMNLPIDPFSTSYWAPDTTSKDQAKSTKDSNLSAPARMPLNTLKGPNQLFPNLKPEPVTKLGKALVAAKPLPPDLLADFKKAIDGSNLSKIGLVEVLKKE